MRQKYWYLCVLFLLLPALIVVADDSDNDEFILDRQQVLQVFTGPLDAVAFHPDNNLIASGGRDNTVRLWDTTDGELIQTIEAHDDWLTALAFSPDGQWIASGSRDNSVKLWNAETGDLVRMITNHRGDVTTLKFSSDGEMLVTAGRDGMIRLHHLASEQIIIEMENFGGSAWDVALSHDGTMLASASEDGSVWLWGLWGDDSPWLKRLDGHLSSATRIAFSTDDRQVASGGLDSVLRVWDIDNLSNDPDIENEPDVLIQAHLAPIMGLDFVLDDDLVTTASLDGTIKVWDTSGRIEAGKELTEIITSGAPLTNLALNTNHSQAASVGTDGVLNLWDMSDESLVAIINELRPPVTVVSATTNTTNSTTLVNPQPVSPEPPSSQQPAPAPPSPSLPDTGRFISIPSAGISSWVTTFFLDGVSWAIDPWERGVGHLQGTAWVGNTGNIALGGHSLYPNGSPGIFYNLYNVNVGDEIILKDNGVEKRYVVVSIREVDYRDVSVVYPTGHNQLTLITCDIPSFVSQTGVYLERLVVIANEI